MSVSWEKFRAQLRLLEIFRIHEVVEFIGVQKLHRSLAKVDFIEPLSGGKTEFLLASFLDIPHLGLHKGAQVSRCLVDGLQALP